MNKKTILAVLVAAAFIFSSFLVFADTADSHGESIDTILSGIRSELNLSPTETILPDKVSDLSLEKLGEAVMSFRIPDPRQHEWMDKMMGGEGSESLANLHKLLGYRYLENGSADFGAMMTGRGYGGFGMEGNFGTGRLGGFMPGYMFGNGSWTWIIPVLLLLLVVTVVILVIVSAKRKRTDYSLQESPLSALKVRYAKGEIDREEFLSMKEELLEK